MTTPESAAITYALDALAPPGTSRLWLYGSPTQPQDTLYHPHQHALSAWQAQGGQTLTHITDIPPHSFDCVILTAPKQQEEASGLLALALQTSRSWVIAVAANDAGGKRLPNMFAAYGLPYDSLAKHKCRIVWTESAPRTDTSLLPPQLLHLSPRAIPLAGESWLTQPGLFGWNQIDAGSQLLLQTLQSSATPITGRVADLGCGYGYLSRHLLQQYPAITQLDALDVDSRAIHCTQHNIPASFHPKTHTLWQDITTWHPSRHYDTIVMNPPFHQGKQEDITLGQAFIHKAWSALSPGGRLYWVANRHLPYEQLVPDTQQLSAEGAFKILTTRKPTSPKATQKKP